MADEEKAMELEALSAIYMDDLILEDENKFEINLVPNPGSDDDKVGITMSVEYSKDYPNSEPVLKLTSIRGVSNQQISELSSTLKSQATENLGSVMIFTLAQTVKEWLDEHNNDDDEEEGEDDDDEEAVKPEDNSSKFSAGTPVTMDSFKAWKAKFDAEMLEAKKGSLDSEKLKRPTGRQLFEIDISLIMSDANMDDGDTVSVEVFKEGRQHQMNDVNWDLFDDEVPEQ
eukprot:TRINITY_DN1292_c0_g1_i1.p1 TRINITY_DN1292_c0_g1~~TRINITY_DN1292_c0_g1_i1.p1  ORF type:complete len:229 (-),score=84.62 TRINITY_DN1292_c0_g1_i1:40-726(-)